MPFCVKQPDADSYIFDPNSIQVVLWVFLVTVVTLFIACLIPVQLGFYYYNSIPFFDTMNIVVLVIFIMDILVNMNTAFEDQEGKLVAKRYDIFLEYSEFWLWMDLIATIPWSIMAVGGRASHLLRLLKLLRLVKFAQLLSSHTISARVEEWAFARYRGFRVLGYACASVLLMHILGCGLFIVVSLEVQVYNVIIANGLTDEDVVGLWLNGLLWSSQTMTTVGYGNLELVTKPEQAYGIIVIMSGAAFYAHIVGVLLEYFHISKHKAHSHETVLNTKYLLETARCPKVMCNEIQRHFARSQAQETIDLKYYEETLLRWNPTQTAKFAIQLHGSWLRRLWWLTSFDPDFLFRLILLVTCRTCDPGEVIVAPGDAINTLWIVNHGFLHQAGTGSMKTMRIYCRSDVFGEEICIRTTLHHTQAIISRAYTDFYTVSRRGYYDLLEEFPIMNTKRCMAGIFYFIRRNGGARSLYKIASQRQKGTDRSAYCDGEFSEG